MSDTMSMQSASRLLTVYDSSSSSTSAFISIDDDGDDDDADSNRARTRSCIPPFFDCNCTRTCSHTVANEHGAVMV